MESQTELYLTSFTILFGVIINLYLALTIRNLRIENALLKALMEEMVDAAQQIKGVLDEK
tara:strand:- start:3224 stop:3403 length:180 start_codon:yes stop_codon:yes gene_type:complete